MFVTTLADQGAYTLVSKTIKSVAEHVINNLDIVGSVVEDTPEVTVDAATKSAKLQVDTSEGDLVIVFIGDDAEVKVRKAFAKILREQENELG